MLQTSRLVFAGALALALVCTEVMPSRAADVLTALAAGKKPVLDGVELPPQAPYLNPKRPFQTLFCLGNGIVGSLADANGQLIAIFGPGYGADSHDVCSTFEYSVDGSVHPIQTDIKRAQGTGVFYGVTSFGEITVYEIDYGCVDQSWLGRLIWFENTSATSTHVVSLQSRFLNATGPLHDAQGKPCGYRQKQISAAFTDPQSSASPDGQTLQTETKSLAPGASCSFGIVYDVAGGSEPAALARIRSIDPVAAAARSLTEWQKWYHDVPPSYRLDRVTDPRARDLIEGGLAVLRMNQSVDGGFMATPTMYRNGYVRDAFHASRALIQTGHFAEAKKWLEWVDSKFKYTGHIADAWGLSDVLEQTKPGEVGLDDVEQTSLYVFCARDYYNATHDLPTLIKVDATLKYCIDIQLTYAEKHGYALPFSGDETEICFAVPAGPAGYGSRGGGDLSWPSTAFAAGAVDFYIQYLRARGLDPAAYTNAMTGKTVNLPQEEAKFQEAMKTFWRTDVPAISAGFHDAFIKMSDGSRPVHPTSNFTLQPICFDVPYPYPDRRKKDVDAIKQFFNRRTGYLQLFPGLDNGFCGHDAGYLLWALVEVKDPMAKDVYEALLNGPSVSWLGYWNEAYSADGTPCTDYAKGAQNGVRSMETGCNIAALAKYWGLGESK